MFCTSSYLNSYNEIRICSYTDNTRIIYTTMELKVNKRQQLAFHVFGNNYDSVQHIVQYASLIVACYLYTVPVAIVPTLWLPLVACYPPVSVNISCQTPALCCW